MSIPQARLLNTIDDFLKDKFISEGFSFVPSQFAFKKKVNDDFVYEVKFVPSRNNWSDEIITYDVHYHIFSPKYKRWCKVNFPGQVILGGGYVYGDHSMTVASKPLYRNAFGYDFVAYNPELIASEIWLDYQNYWKNYFLAHDCWEKIHSTTQHLHMKIDSLILLKRSEEAIDLISHHLSLRKKRDLGTRVLTGSMERDLSFLQSRLGYLLYIGAS